MAWSKVGYRRNNWDTRQVDEYLVPQYQQGPFDRSWQGVQKLNILSTVGTKRSSMYGTLPYNPMQNGATQTKRITSNNLASKSLGEGVVRGRAYDDYTQSLLSTPQTSSLWDRVLAKIRTL